MSSPLALLRKKTFQGPLHKTARSNFLIPCSRVGEIGKCGEPKTFFAEDVNANVRRKDSTCLNTRGWHSTSQPTDHTSIRTEGWQLCNHVRMPTLPRSSASNPVQLIEFLHTLIGEFRHCPAITYISTVRSSRT